MDSPQIERLKGALAGHYQFERELGEGAYATVFLARDLRLERFVAVKVLHVDPKSEESEIRFLREVRFLATLQHPNIVPVHDSGHLENLLYYVMPYVRGESLRQRIERVQKLSIAEAIRITNEICDAVDCAHSCGVIHRDIKPENILLSGSHPMLADFGVARAINPSQSKKITRTGIGSPGTPAYMSPEQLLGEKDIDNRTDIYSLGCVLYEMLTGHAPFEKEGGFVRRFTEAPPSARMARGDVSSLLDEVITKALGRTPSERYPTAGEMGKALLLAGTDHSSQIEPPTTHESPSKRFPKVEVAAIDGDASVRQPFWKGRVVRVGGPITLLLVILTAGSVLFGRRVAASLTGRDLVTSSSPPLDPKHIAVLYFDDRSPGKTVGHIANGLTEDLIDALSEIRALHVISPTGVRAYQGNVVALDTLARRLNVGTIVSGSVESSGPLFRVTVRLIDATTGQQLQSRTLEQKIDKLFTLQDTLVSDVALFLREHLGREIRLREKRSGTASVQAWEIAQRGEDAAQKGGDMIRAGDDKSAVGLLVRADSLFGRAHRLDPNWIVPIVDRGWLAYSFAFITPAFIPREWERATESGVGQPDASLVHWVLRGIEYADSALRRSSDSPEALALRGGLRYRLAIFSPNTRADTLMPLAEADLRMALSSRPDFANAWFALGDLYYQQGRFSEADRALRTAYDADAFLSEVRSVIATLFFASLHREHFDDARSWCRMGLKRFAGDPRFADCELSLLGRTGRGKEDVRRSWGLVNRVERGDSVGMLAPLWGYRRMMVAAVLARSGMEDSARAVLAQSRKDLPRHPASSDPGWDEAYVYLLLGDRDTAVKVLARRLAAEPYERGFVARSPWYRELRADPRFLALVRAGV